MTRIRGQGTTEYLIILAVIIVIALVVVGVLGFVPGIGGGTTENRSRAYWKGATPFAIQEYDFDDTAFTFTVRNTSSEPLTMTSMAITGPSGSRATPSTGSLRFAPGEERTYTVTVSNSSSCTNIGDGIQSRWDIEFVYTTSFLSGKEQIGDMPFVGTCQN